MNIKDKLSKAYGLAHKDDEKKPLKPGKAAARPVSQAATAEPLAKSRDTRSAVDLLAEQNKAKPGKSGLIKAAETSNRFIKTGLPGIEKAAKFLLLLGQDEAANVIRHLKPQEIENISRAIAKITHIDTAEANAILLEFGWLAKTSGKSFDGGADTAERMLTAAFGEEKAREVLKKAVPDTHKPFTFLNEFSAKQVMSLLKDESSQVLALIIPYIEPKLASSLIGELPIARRTEVVKRIAKLERMDNEVLFKVEEVLKNKLAKQGRPETMDHIDGASVLAGILRHAGTELEGSILADIREDNPELSQDIRERLFTAEDLLRVSNKDVQKGLRDLGERDIALILKGKSQALRDKFLSNVSQSKRTIILEEYDIMGTVRRDEVDKATRSCIDYFKKRWEAGKLVLEGDEDLID